MKKDQLDYSDSRLSFLLTPKCEIQMENLTSQSENKFQYNFVLWNEKNPPKTLKAFRFHCSVK